MSLGNESEVNFVSKAFVMTSHSHDYLVNYRPSHGIALSLRSYRIEGIYTQFVCFARLLLPAC